VNCRSIAEIVQTTSKPGVYVDPGSAWREPVYWPRGVRLRGSASSVQAFMLNCGNLPKKSGGTRMLGVPTVADRVAQTVVKLVLELVLEPVK
jgi:hypothetical protein